MATPFQRPRPIVEANRDARHSASQMNSAVSRITGMSRSVLTPKDELNEQTPTQQLAQQPAQHQQFQPQSQAQPQTPARPSKYGLTQWDYTEADMQEGTNRANQSNRGPESSVYERGRDNARDNEPRDQKMAKQTAKARPYGTKDQDDDEEETVGKTQPEDRYMAGDEVTEGSITHVAGLSMDLFREMAGMTPIYDIQESQQYYAEAVTEAEARGTGQVPTRGATQYTKMPGGYGDQEGAFAQDLHPKEYGNDGADSEMTMDQAIGMLKKEGLDADYMWSRFLGENQLSIPILEMLCDEAMETNNEDMAEELMQLEAAFDHFYENALVETYGPELAEGLLSKIMGKKKAAASGAPRQAMGTDVTPAGSGGTSDVDMKTRMAGAKPPDSDGSGNIVGKTIKLKSIAGGALKKPSNASGLPKRLMPKTTSAGGAGGVKLPKRHPRAGGGTIESRMSLDCDDDGQGSPKMPWDNAQASFQSLASKYGGSKNAGARA
jgi:hypothetical protein